MPAQCCVKTCRRQKVAGDGISFFRLPWHNTLLVNEWLRRAGIGENSSRSLRICGRHFEGQFGPGINAPRVPTLNIPDYTAREAADSMLQLANQLQSHPTEKRHSQITPSLHVETSFTSKSPHMKTTKRKFSTSTSSSQVTPKYKHFKTKSAQRTPPVVKATQVTPKRKITVKTHTDINISSSIQTDMPSCLFVVKRDASCQTDTEKMVNKCVQASISRSEEIKSSNKELKKFTGIEDYSLFLILHKYVTSMCAESDCDIETHLKNPAKVFPHISTEDQLLIVLYKLKRNPVDSVLASEFKISTGRVSEIFKFWICRMYCKFKIIKLWPSTEKIDMHMPLTTKQNFPDLAAISDCVEFSTQVPRGPLAGKQLFSHYKNCHTVKAMYTTGPNGALIHCSDFYGGNASDKEIFGQSDLANRLQPGQGLMVDKGFLIKDLIQGKDIKLYRPPFLSEKTKQFQPESRDSGRLIARSRIIVENFNARLSTYAFLKQKKIPVLCLPIMNEIGFVCGFLANLGTLLRKPNLTDTNEEMDI